MTAPSQTPEAAGLEPCPFCGGTAEIEQFGNTRVSTIYSCDDCGCRLETGEEFNHGRAWNRRAAPASPLPGSCQLSKNLGQLNPELFAENANQIGQCSGITGELSGERDEIARLIWQRFAPSSDMDEANALHGEYVLVADDIIARRKLPAAPTGAK